MATAKDKQVATDTGAATVESIKAEIVAAAKAEAEKIIAEAQAEVKKIVADSKRGDEPYKESEEEIAEANELVEIKLFKDKDKYNAPVMVILNGHSYLINRGVKVKVPRKVARIIACADDQMGVAADVVAAKTEEFEQKKDQLT